MTARIDEAERSMSLVLDVSVSEDELPENEELWVENQVEQYIEEEYGIWYSVDIVVQEAGRDVSGTSKRFGVAVVD